MIIFKKEYDGESICDLGRDASEAIMEEYNPEIKIIPKDQYGIQRGTFKVTIEWAEYE